MHFRSLLTLSIYILFWHYQVKNISNLELPHPIGQIREKQVKNLDELLTYNLLSEKKKRYSISTRSNPFGNKKINDKM